jgi:hypothetical protein
VNVVAREDEESHCEKHDHADVNMEVWRGSILLENKVLAVFL